MRVEFLFDKNLLWQINGIFYVTWAKNDKVNLFWEIKLLISGVFHIFESFLASFFKKLTVQIKSSNLSSIIEWMKVNVSVNTHEPICWESECKIVN